MPFRHGNTYRALGWLAVVCLCFGSALAQQDVEEPSATVNEGQGVAGEAPAPEKDSGESAEREQAPPADPLPTPAPVEREIDAEPACGPRCEAAQQREKDDLVAQQRMADSTRDVVIVTEWQLYVGGVGILLLVGTLVLTVRSTNAAVDANRIARESAERQLRAYVNVKSTSMLWTQDKGPIATVRFKNGGQTPAHELRIWALGIIGSRRPDFEELADEHIAGLAILTLGPGAEIPHDVAVRVAPDFNAGGPGDLQTQSFVWGRVTYRDIFDETRITEFRLRVIGSRDNGRTYILGPTNDDNQCT